MVYKMTKKIYDWLQENKPSLKVFIDEREKSSNVWLQFGIKNGGSYRIRFISSDDDNDVSVRAYAIVSVDSAKRSKVLEAVNSLNNEYRYVRFVIDEDNDINVEYDFPVRADNVEECAMEMISRFVDIIDEAYPTIMRVIFN